jgi:hypothetical protein
LWNDISADLVGLRISVFGVSADGGYLLFSTRDVDKWDVHYDVDDGYWFKAGVLADSNNYTSTTVTSWTDVPSHLALLDTGSGACKCLSVLPGLETPINPFHASISPNGSYVVFSGSNPSLPTHVEQSWIYSYDVGLDSGAYLCNTHGAPYNSGFLTQHVTLVLDNGTVFFGLNTGAGSIYTSTIGIGGVADLDGNNVYGGGGATLSPNQAYIAGYFSDYDIDSNLFNYIGVLDAVSLVLTPFYTFVTSDTIEISGQNWLLNFNGMGADIQQFAWANDTTPEIYLPAQKDGFPGIWGIISLSAGGAAVVEEKDLTLEDGYATYNWQLAPIAFNTVDMAKKVFVITGATNGGATPCDTSTYLYVTSN